MKSRLSRRVLLGLLAAVLSLPKRIGRAEARQEQRRFRMSVRCRRVEAGKQDGGAGFRIGVRNLIDDHRSNCFARGVGVDAGLVGGRLVLGTSSTQIAGGGRIGTEGVILVLEGLTTGENCASTLTAFALDGTELGKAMNFTQAADIEGNVAIVSNFDREIPKSEGARYRPRLAGDPAPGRERGREPDRLGACAPILDRNHRTREGPP